MIRHRRRAAIGVPKLHVGPPLANANESSLDEKGDHLTRFKDR